MSTSSGSGRRERTFAAQRPISMTKRLLIPALFISLVAAACGTDDGPGSTAPPEGTLIVEVVAGPQCPVQQDPPDPECEDKPVEGVEIVVVNKAGGRIPATTGADGRVALDLPVGTYEIIALELEEFMGTPGPASVTVGADATSEIQFTYDTGIR